MRLSVRTPPNIVRRDRFGIPAQALGIVLGKLPQRALNPIGRTLRRLTIPDLSAHGLRAPRDGFTQVLRTGTIPILDVGIVDAVRSGAVEIVAAVESLDRDEVVLAGGERIAPDAVIAATGLGPVSSPWSAISASSTRAGCRSCTAPSPIATPPACTSSASS